MAYARADTSIRVGVLRVGDKTTQVKSRNRKSIPIQSNKLRQIGYLAELVPIILFLNSSFLSSIINQSINHSKHYSEALLRNTGANSTSKQVEQISLSFKGAAVQ